MRKNPAPLQVNHCLFQQNYLWHTSITQIGNFVISRTRLNPILYPQIIASDAAAFRIARKGHLHTAEPEAGETDLIHDYGITLLVVHQGRFVEEGVGVATENNIDIVRRRSQVNVIHFIVAPVLITQMA
jgi:hypothetical protein